jgi:hypothetical protein
MPAKHLLSYPQDSRSFLGHVAGAGSVHDGTNRRIIMEEGFVIKHLEHCKPNNAFRNSKRLLFWLRNPNFTAVVGRWKCFAGVRNTSRVRMRTSKTFQFFGVKSWKSLVTGLQAFRVSTHCVCLTNYEAVLIWLKGSLYILYYSKVSNGESFEAVKF